MVQKKIQHDIWVNLFFLEKKKKFFSCYIVKIFCWSVVVLIKVSSFDRLFEGC